MKIPGAQKARGSFGIPEHLAPENFTPPARKEGRPSFEQTQPGAVAAGDPAFSSETMPALGETAEQLAASLPEVTDETVAKTDPLFILKKELGMDFNADDFHRLLYKGYVEKVVDVCYNPKTKNQFTAVFKTLTGDEYDCADELLAEEMKDVEMTRAGLDSRRNMWVLSFGITKLDGRDIVKPAMTNGKYDPKATARARKAVISAMSPAILNRLMRMHGTFSMQLDRLVESPNSGFLVEP